MAQTNESDKQANQEGYLEKGWRSWLVNYVRRTIDERAAQKQKETPEQKAARKTATATIWIAAFTAILTTATVGSWIVMSKQLKEMRDAGDQTNELIRLYGGQVINETNIARATQQLADTAQKSRLDMIITSRKQLSPYVDLLQIGLAEPIVPDHETGISNLFANTGNTPAIDTQIAATVWQISDGSRPTCDFRDFGSRGTIARGGTFDTTISIPPMPLSHVDEVKSGKRLIYIVGRIKYRDDKRPIQQTFCQVYNPATGQMVGCKYQCK